MKDRSNHDRIASLLERSYDDPSFFNAAILGGAPFWWRQEEMCRLVVANHSTIIAAGNSVGKSHWLARLVLWWLCTRPNSLVVTTAPSHDQLDGVLWKNIRQAVEASKIPLGLEMRAKPLRARFGEGWEITGVATTKMERISGRHNANLLAVCDEASGIAPEIKEGIDSLVPIRFVAIGNPVRADGWFRESFEAGEKQSLDPSIDSEERIASIRVPSTDSPDIGLTHSPRGLASGGWLRRMYRQYGRHSLWTRTHIDALFPEAATEGLIIAEWLDRATAVMCPDRRTGQCGLPRISVDLGEGVGRDRTVILVRDDMGILEVVGERTLDLAEAASEIYRLATRWGVRQERITFDGGGIGRDLPKHLVRYGIEAKAYFGAASGGKNFTNLRTASAWALRSRLDPESSADPDKPFSRQAPFHIPVGSWWPAMRKELIAFHYDLIGSKTRLETKEDMKKRLGFSPDLADALIQSFSW